MLTSFKKEIKELLPIGLPAVFSQLAQMATGFVDTIMAGQYSTEALASIAVGTSLLHPVIVFFLGIFLAFNPIIAHFNGEKQSEKIANHFNAALIFAVIFFPISIFALEMSTDLLPLLDIEQSIQNTAAEYLRATEFGFLFLLLFLALRFCNEGLFSTKAILVITLISVPCNVVLNYWFIYGGLGLSSMGAVGVGYATSLTWLIMLIGLSIYTFRNSYYQSLGIFKHWSLPSLPELKAILYLGFPMAITLGFEITMFAAVALMIAKYPVEVMGAHQIATNIAALTFMVPLGLSQAITARVSFFNGRKDWARRRIAGFTGIIICTLLMLLFGIVMVLIPSHLVSIYTNDQSLKEIAISLLFFAAVFQFSDGLQVSSSGALRGLKDTKLPMILTAISYWLIGFPTGYYLAEFQLMGAKGYWIGLISGLTAAAILLQARWVILSKRLS